MFEKASRLKLRFDTPKGQLSVEDLWDLPLTSIVGKATLDSIAIELNKQLKNSDEVSFVRAEKKSDPTVQLKFDIARHIIEVRMAENAAAATERAASERQQKLLAIIAKREDADLENLPLDELRKAAGLAG